MIDATLKEPTEKTGENTTRCTNDIINLISSYTEEDGMEVISVLGALAFSFRDLAAKSKICYGVEAATNVFNAIISKQDEHNDKKAHMDNKTSH